MTMATMSTPAGSNSQRPITGVGAGAGAAAVPAAAAAVERHRQQDNGQVRTQAKQVWLRVLILRATMQVMEAV